MVITGDGTLAAGIASALSQCGQDVRMVKAHAKPSGPGIEELTVAAEGGAPLCHVAATDDGVCWSFTGPPNDRAPGTPSAAFRRAASFAAATASAGGLGSRFPPGAVTAIAARQIVRGIVRAGQVRPPAGTVTFLDRRTLRTSTHNVTVHPYDVPAKQRTQEESPDGPSLGRAALTERWRRLSDDRFGVFAELDDTQFRQLPLKVTLARMSDPSGLLSAPPAVVGAGIDRDSARERAMLQALAAYGSVVVDPRLLAGRDGAFLGPREADATQLLEPVRNGSIAAFVRATGLIDGRERLVPAQQAFPVLRTPTLRRLPCGTSAALDWRQALAHGLLQQCVRLTVSGSPLQRRHCATLAADDFDQDPGVRFLAAMVKAARIGLTLHDLTGPAGIPVVACTSSSGETVYRGGGQLADAVREALTAVLFRYQQARDPVLAAAGPTAASAGWIDPAGPVSLSPERLVGVLTDLGYPPSVVALDHDRAVHETFPCVLRVVLTRPVTPAPPGPRGSRR
jgi:hypothetical protein